MATIDELGARAAARVRGQVRPFVSLDVPTLPQHRSPRRWAILAAGALAAASLAAVILVQSTDHDRTTPPSGTTDIGVTTTLNGTGVEVVGNGLVFHLPAVFRYSTEGFTSTGEGYGNFYSTAPMLHGPCTAGCGIGNLAPTTPDAVVIGIGSIVLPLDPNDHPNTTIAGLDAHFVTSAGCGDELITVRFDQGFGDTVIRACLSGPDLAAGERLVRDVLATATRTGGEETTTPTTIAPATPDLDANLDPSTAIDAPAGKVIATIGVGSGPGELGFPVPEGGPLSPVLIDEDHLLIIGGVTSRSLVVDRRTGDLTGGFEPTPTSAPPVTTIDPTLSQAELFGTDLRILWQGRHVRWRVPASVGVTAAGLALPDGSFVINPAVDPGREDVVRLFPDGSSTWWRLPKLVLGSINGITVDAKGIHVLTYDGKKFQLLEWPLPAHP